MKQKYEYDLGTAQGLYEFIADRVFKTHQEGLHNDYWGAFADLFNMAQKKEALEKQNAELTELLKNAVKKLRTHYNPKINPWMKKFNNTLLEAEVKEDLYGHCTECETVHIPSDGCNKENHGQTK